MSASCAGVVSTRLRGGLRFLQCLQVGLLSPCVTSAAVNLQMVRHRRTKHWNPKFKKLRAEKVIKVELPDFNEARRSDQMSIEEMRSKMKEKGLLPPRPWMERPFYISCTGDVFEPYVPPEGDGRVSAISVPGAKQKLEFLEKKSTSMMAIRKIRSFDEDFDKTDFVGIAQDIYIKAHETMISKDKIALRQLVTERAYPEIRHNTLDKTIRWKWVKSLEPPRVVHARCTNVVTKENIFAQITVRFHSQQILAIYDRFGRLIHGSEMLAKDVLEYVVFEKHIANQYGEWRLHSKIIPEWMPPTEPSLNTHRLEKSSLPVEDTESQPSENVKEAEPQQPTAATSV